MPSPCMLGVDVGTSSSKGVLAAADGRVLATAVREHSVRRPAPGQVEMDAQIWWSEFISITRELATAASDEGAQISAVGVSGMGPCVLLVDEDGEPVRDAILYGVDTRARVQIERIESELSAAEIVRVGGSALSSQAAGPKIAWVADNEPDAYARARRLLMPASWLAAKLTGAYVLDHHSASQCNPLYDIEQGTWQRAWWERIAPGIAPPELVWPDDIIGEITSAAAAATGLAPGVPVIAGTIDAWTEAVSVGAVRVGDLMLMYGTTMFLVATTDRVLRSPSMWTTAGVSPGAHCLAGGMATSGAITAWLRDLVDGEYAALLAEAERSGVGAQGLVMLPYFAGERTPVQDPDARGVVAGLTLEHTRGDLYRAALEATAFGVRHNVETMRDAGAGIERIVAVGGGTQGGLWTQIISDVTGLEQQIPTTTVGAAYGAAYLAAKASEPAGPPRIDAWNPVAGVRTPDPATSAAYDERYALYRELYPSTSAIVHALARSTDNPDT